MWKKVFVITAMLILLLSNVAGWCRAGISNQRLGQCRAELESLRIELALASNRERDIKASVERTGEILCQSISTVQDLREALKVIRTEYERMENVLRNSGRSGGSVNGDNSSTSPKDDNTLTGDDQ